MLAKLIDGVEIDGPKLSEVAGRLIRKNVYAVNDETGEIYRIYILGVDGHNVSAMVTLPLMAGMIHMNLDGNKLIAIGVEI